MRTELRKRGDKGELEVIKFLERRGFQIIEQNYYNKFGEIDIICKRGDNIHFVEVKSSYSNFLAEQNMTKKKMDRIIKSALLYMMSKNIDEIKVFFDLVSVDFKNHKITIYPNVNIDFC
jgi:putative endonuclease